tara:strand:- start:541 stop:906 length:366 start_codon:yes stop_codon:yes gene_type:complete
MTVQDYIDLYLEGWRLGDPQRSLQACAADFYYDDPNTGRIQRHDFVEFVESFKSYGASLNNGIVPVPFLEYSDTIVDDGPSPALIWCWWRVNGTEFQGSALVKADQSGIRSERIAYFSRLP